MRLIAEKRLEDAMACLPLPESRHSRVAKPSLANIHWSFLASIDKLSPNQIGKMKSILTPSGAGTVAANRKSTWPIPQVQAGAPVPRRIHFPVSCGRGRQYGGGPIRLRDAHLANSGKWVV